MTSVNKSPKSATTLQLRWWVGLGVATILLAGVWLVFVVGFAAIMMNPETAKTAYLSSLLKTLFGTAYLIWALPGFAGILVGAVLVSLSVRNLKQARLKQGEG